MLHLLRELSPKQRSAVLASYLGWTLDAFDFFLLIFLVTDVAQAFGVSVTAITIAITVAGTGTAAVTIYSSPSGSSASLPGEGGARPARLSVSAEIRHNLNRTEATLLASGYKVNLDVSFDKNCAANSYGQVHHFFLSDPCKWLARASLTLRDSDHAAALIAISWVSMRNIALAKHYKTLVDSPGTGNITELTRLGGPYRGVRFNGEFYSSGRAGTVVWNAQVQPVGRLPVTVTMKILRDSRQ